MDKIILAFYINKYELENYTDAVFQEIGEKFDPTRYILTYFSTEGESRIECVYPKLIASNEVVEENEQLLKELTKDLKKIINQPKDGVYILHNDQLFTLEDWEKKEDPTIATYIVLIENDNSFKINKNIIEDVIYDDAIYFDLPDKIQANVICRNIDKLKNAIGIIGGDWFDGCFWTKTESTSDSAWYYSCNSQYLHAYYKYKPYNVREVTNFKIIKA